jgi:PKD repeat protein
MQNGEPSELLGTKAISGLETQVTVELDKQMSGDGTVMAAIHPDDGGQPNTNTLMATDTAQMTIGPPAILENPPKDPNDDGLYEDVRGDGTVDIFDVQALFRNLDNPDVQNNSELFNFQGGNPDKVTIFDVQSLFRRIS